MSESTFSRHFREKARGKWVRVENGIGPGFPDIVGVYRNVTVMVETKVLRNPDIRMGLSHAQIAWHHSWTAAGGISWLLARYGPRGASGRVVLVRGDRFVELRDRAKVEGSRVWIEAAVLDRYNRDMPWKEIGEWLITW